MLRQPSDLQENTSLSCKSYSHFCLIKKYIYILQTLLLFLCLCLLSEMNTGGEVTHSGTTDWVQHGSWSTEQAEELGAPPLLCWQVPAWVDHLQRQQRCRHRLEDRWRRKQGQSLRKEHDIKLLNERNIWLDQNPIYINSCLPCCLTSYILWVGVAEISAVAMSLSSLKDNDTNDDAWIRVNYPFRGSVNSTV